MNKSRTKSPASKAKAKQAIVPAKPEQATREEIEAAIADARPTTRDSALKAMERFEADAKPPRAVKAGIENGGVTISYESKRGADDPGERAMVELLLMQAFGTRSIDFLNTMTGELVRLQRCGDGFNETSLNSAVAILASAAPENELEAMLVAQMIASNEAVMRVTRCMLANCANPEAAVSYGNLSAKFMRLYADQLLALAKIRRGGVQEVRHVHVNEGGQAVIAGQIHHHAGGGSRKRTNNPMQPDR